MTRLLWLRAILSTGTPVNYSKQLYSILVQLCNKIYLFSILTGSTIKYEPCFSSEGFKPDIDLRSALSPLRKCGNEAAIGKSVKSYIFIVVI